MGLFPGKFGFCDPKQWFLQHLTFSFGRELDLTNNNYNDLVSSVYNSFQVKL